MHIAYHTNSKNGQRYVYKAEQIDASTLIDMLASDEEIIDAFKFRGIIFMDFAGHYECMLMARQHFARNRVKSPKLAEIYRASKSYRKYTGFVCNGMFVSRDGLLKRRDAAAAERKRNNAPYRPDPLEDAILAISNDRKASQMVTESI